MMVKTIVVYLTVSGWWRAYVKGQANLQQWGSSAESAVIKLLELIGENMSSVEIERLK